MAGIQCFTTARLVADRLSLVHFPAINRLHSDPLVKKTLSADGNVLSEDDTREHLQRCTEHWERHGFGLWVFRAKSDSQFVGRGGLPKYQIDGKEEIGLAHAMKPSGGTLVAEIGVFSWPSSLRSVVSVRA